MASRLNAGAAAAHAPRKSADDMRTHCWRLNTKARELGWQRWSLVRETADGWAMEELRGVLVDEIWRMLDDKPLVPAGWARAEVFKSIGLTRWRLERGMSPDAYMLWAIEAREARRKAWVAERLDGSVDA